MEVALAVWLGASVAASAGCMFFGKKGPAVNEPAAELLKPAAPQQQHIAPAAPPAAVTIAPPAAAAAAAAMTAPAADVVSAADVVQVVSPAARTAFANGHAAAPLAAGPGAREASATGRPSSESAVESAEWRSNRFTSSGSSTNATPISGDWALSGRRSSNKDVYSLIQQHNLELGPLLGSGNFGRVYQGTWEGRPVAIKVVPHGWATAAKMASEMELCTTLQHRHVVKAHFHFTVETRTQTIVPINALIKHVPKRDPRDMMAAGSVVPLIRSSSTEGSTEGSLLAGHMGSMGGGTPTLHDFNTHSSAFASSTPGLMTNGSLGPLSEEGVTSTDITMESGALFPDDDDQDVLQSVVVQQKCDRGNLAGALQKSDMFKTDKGVVNLHAILMRARDVAWGLEYLHKCKVCHGDLKAENVLLNSDPMDPYGVIALLADFGMSQVLEQGKSHKTTRSMGTVAYMSPETLLKGEVYPSTDVYSFGIVLWELFSGATPYGGLNTGEIMHSVLVKNTRPAFPDSVPVEYKELADDCWQLDRHKRPTIDKVVARIETLLGQCKGLQGEMEEKALGLSGYL